MNHPLPEYFAIFDDNPIWRPEFHKNRYAIYRYRGEHAGIVPVDLLGGERGFLEGYSVPPAAENRFFPVITSLRNNFWWYTKTALTLILEDDSFTQVPVVDFEQRDVFPAIFPVTPQNDSIGSCMTRQSDQRQRRLRMQDAILAHLDAHPQSFLATSVPVVPVASAPPAPQPAPLIAAPPQPAPPQPAPLMPFPAFVAEALVQAAIAKKDTCPITCQEFTECDRVTVTNCYHCFESSALSTWLSSKSVCPTCKEPVRSSQVISIRT